MRAVVNQRELLRLRIGINELVAQVRQSGVGDIADVNYAILEDNGRMTVLPKVDKRPPTTEELRDVLGSTQPRDTGLAHVLIIDGKIIKENLKLAEKNENFIMKNLSEHKFTLSEVLLFTCNDTGEVNIIKKENVGGERKIKYEILYYCYYNIRHNNDSGNNRVSGCQKCVNGAYEGRKRRRGR